MMCVCVHYVCVHYVCVQQEGRKIQVTQHHFTSWPDKGVPISPWPLVDFHMVVSAHVAAEPHEAPIVVHCR